MGNSMTWFFLLGQIKFDHSKNCHPKGLLDQPTDGPRWPTSELSLGRFPLLFVGSMEPNSAASAWSRKQARQAHLPSSNLTWLLNITIFNGKTHYKWLLKISHDCWQWSFTVGFPIKNVIWSIAILNYRRVWFWCLPYFTRQFCCFRASVIVIGWLV